MRSVLLGVLACGACASAWADDAPSYPDLLLKDAKQVLTSPSRWQQEEWRGAGYAALAVAGTMALADRPLRDEMRRHRGGADSFMRNVERFGAGYSFAVLGGFYAAGVASDNAHTKSVAEDGLAASLIASGVITPVLKLAFGRSRPAQNQGVAQFRPFSGGTSFPSGHTTQAFAVASAIAANYDETWVKSTAYGVAGLVGVARAYHDAHFASDVVAGALIGSTVGNAVVALNRAERSKRKVSLLPIGADGTAGLSLAARF